MSDTMVSYTDLSSVVNAVNNISNNIRVVNDNIGVLSNRLDAVEQRLQTSFMQMIKEQRMQAALQRAITEIIRVRQEIEKKFGKYQLVRDNMLGILQATDLGLIKESTISRISEELMLSTPNYWLAPCVVALAAWIANNEDLAKRAIKEAVKRDRERTCMLFALISRRAEKSEACYQWLRAYFAEQDPTSAKKSTTVLIDAYFNGIFGDDKKHICSEQINSWMQTLRDRNSDFDLEQKRKWKEYFDTLNVPQSDMSALRLFAKPDDVARMDNFVKRIHAVDDDGGAKSEITGIANATINREELVNKVDGLLWNLVTQCVGEEEELNNEEEELKYIKEFRGDETKAKRVVNEIHNLKEDKPVDFAKRISDSAMNKFAPLSERKACIWLLRDYITVAYNEYITENKDSYPEEISLSYKESLSGTGKNDEGKSIYNWGGQISWNGLTGDCSNKDELCKALKAQYEKGKKAEIDNVKIPMINKIFFFTLPFAKSKKKRTIAEIEKKYNEQSKKAIDNLQKALSEREACNSTVANFCSKDNWDQFDIADIKEEKENV